MKNKRKQQTLKETLAGRLLTGIVLNGETLSLRCLDAVLTVDLKTRNWKFGKTEAVDYWLIFPGLLRIARVLEDESQITLIVSGALYSSQIVIRKRTDWRIVFDANFVA